MQVYIPWIERVYGREIGTSARARENFVRWYQQATQYAREDTKRTAPRLSSDLQAQDRAA